MGEHQSPPAVPGAGRCPKCACRRVRRETVPDPTFTAFYSRTIEVCGNPACKAVWEPFDAAQLLDAEDPRTSCFTEPCENCAFRTGSFEQADPARWRDLMAQLKGADGDPWTVAQRGGGFYCHKGVPLDPTGDSGFAYPRKADGSYDRSKMRMCAGWIRMLRAAHDRVREDAP